MKMSSNNVPTPMIMDTIDTTNDFISELLNWN
jgi:hypothetical protein